MPPPLANTYLMFNLSDETWVRQAENQRTMRLCHHNKIAGKIVVRGADVIIRGDLKTLLKHVLILFPRKDQEYTNFTTGVRAEVRNNPECTTVITLEMYEKAFLFYFEEYRPTSVFFFIVSGNRYDVSELTRTFLQLSHTCVIGNEGYPSFDQRAYTAICRIMDQVEPSIFDAVVGFMTLERRQCLYDENDFMHKMRKKREESREEPEFQVILVCPNKSFVMCEVYPEWDAEIAAVADILVGLKQCAVKREDDT